MPGQLIRLLILSFSVFAIGTACNQGGEEQKQIFTQALQAYEARRLENAANLFEKLGNSNKYQPGAGIMRAKSLFYLDRVAEARAVLEDLNGDYPANAAVHHWLGRIYVRQNEDPRKAAEHFRRSIELDETPFESQYYLGRIYEEQGQVKEALLEYNRAVASKRRFDKIHYSLADLYDRVGMKDRAIQERREMTPGATFDDGQPEVEEDEKEEDK